MFCGAYWRIMSFLVKQKSGNNTYVYEVESYWDKEKKQPRQHKKIIGKIDPVTGKIVPTRKNKVKTTKDYGSVYFLEKISKQLKLDNLLKEIFGDDSKKILYLAYYLISENSSLHLFEQWISGVSIEKSSLSKLKNITSQKLSVFLSKIGVSDDKIFSFFELWISQYEHKEGIFYDISSISSYSEKNEYVERGYNRDHESLNQVNVGMLYSKESELPLRYDITPGSITDVVTLKRIIEYNEAIGLKKDILYIVDKGFFSRKNLEKEFKNHNVIIPLSFSTNLSKELLEVSKKKLEKLENMFLYNDSVYYFNKLEKDIYGKKYDFYVMRDYKKHEAKKGSFYKKILEIESYFLKNEFKNIEDMKEELVIVAKSYKKFFKISNDLKFEKNIKNINKEIERFGTIILFTNIKNMDNNKIIQEYRSKDRVEQMFHSMKHNLDFKRMKIHKADTMKGKFFILFIALIIDTHILNIKTKSKNKKIKKYTRKEIIKEMKKIKETTFTTSLTQISDLTKKAKDLFKEFNIELPKT